LLNHFLESNNDKDTFKTIIGRLGEKAKEEIDRRAPFESALHTFSYTIDNSTNYELKTEKENWKSYLHMEKADNNYQNVKMLYKRMLVTFYDDFSVWRDYIDYLASTMSQIDKCRDIYKYLREHPVADDKNSIIEIYTENASFEEKQGQIKLARKIHQTINNVLCPNLIKGITEYVKFEQRVGGPKKIILEFLEDSLERAIKSEDEFATIFLTVNTCRFHFANEQDLDLVFDIFSDSVKSFRNSKPLFLNLIKLLESIQSKENKLYSRSFEIMEKATLDAKSEFGVADKIELATSYLNWLTSHCTQSTYIDLVQDRFIKASLVQGTVSSIPNPEYMNGGQPPAGYQDAYSGEKRVAEDLNAVPVDDSHKRQKTDE
jgi:hypothetical protein